MAATVSIDNHGWIELRPVLHEEVNRLPDKYRVPVILCYLEGKTNEEAAELLKWPVGTVKGRLSRARDLLRSRLARRGLALSAALLVSSLSSGTVIAEVVPTRLIEKTVAGAMVVSDRQPSASAPISPAVAQMMSLAAAAPWVSKAAVLALLLAVIVTALASLGLTASPRMLYGSDFNLGAFFTAPPGSRSPAPISTGSCSSCSSTGCGSLPPPP
jgi:hypothetical protein